MKVGGYEGSWKARNEQEEMKADGNLEACVFCVLFAF